MCGIAGFAENSHFQSPEGDRERDRALVHRMSKRFGIAVPMMRGFMSSRASGSACGG